MTHTPDPKAEEASHLFAALRGDPDQFSALTEPYRRELQVHCYRILGSFHEAEDLVQETFLRAWKRLATYEGRASFRAWLYKIATNACLDFLDQRRSRRLLPFQAGPASDPAAAIQPPTADLAWLEPLPEEWLGDPSAANPEARYTASEAISLSFLTALQVLPPRQRAVLILRDVLDFSAQETADVLEITLSSANSALHRARVTLATRYSGREPEAAVPSLNEERIQWLLDHFVRAWENADVNGLVALLKEDAILAMPPSPSWYQGREAIRAFVAATVFAERGMFGGQASNRWRLISTRANGSPAFAMYQRTPGNEYQAFGIHVLEADPQGLTAILSFLDASLPTRFGLPAMLGDGSTQRL